MHLSDGKCSLFVWDVNILVVDIWYESLFQCDIQVKSLSERKIGSKSILVWRGKKDGLCWINWFCLKRYMWRQFSTLLKSLFQVEGTLLQKVLPPAVLASFHNNNSSAFAQDLHEYMSLKILNMSHVKCSSTSPVFLIAYHVFLDGWMYVYCFPAFQIAISLYSYPYGKSKITPHLLEESNPSKWTSCSFYSSAKMLLLSPGKGLFWKCSHVGGSSTCRKIQEASKTWELAVEAASFLMQLTNKFSVHNIPVWSSFRFLFSSFRMQCCLEADPQILDTHVSKKHLNRTNKMLPNCSSYTTDCKNNKRCREEDEARPDSLVWILNRKAPLIHKMSLNLW